MANHNATGLWGNVMKSRKNTLPVVGNDGYYYFRYTQGAQYEITVGTKTTLYEIVDCYVENETQTYCVRVIYGANVKHRDMTIERLNYLFSQADKINVINAGDKMELPLTKAEVELYYTRHVKLRNKRRRESNAKLKDDKDYQKLLSEEKELSPLWAQAIYNDNADAGELAGKMQEIALKKRAIMDKLGVSPADLKTPETCETCNDKGIMPNGNICACAYARSDKIKAYCGAERHVEQQKELFLNENKNS